MPFVPLTAPQATGNGGGLPADTSAVAPAGGGFVALNAKTNPVPAPAPALPADNTPAPAPALDAPHSYISDVISGVKNLPSEFATRGKALIDSFNANNKVQKSAGNNLGTKALAIGADAGNVAGAIGGGVGDILGTVISPALTDTAKAKLSSFTSDVNNKIAKIPGMTPEIQKSLGDVFNTATLLGGEGAAEKAGLPTVEEGANAIKTGTKTAVQGAKDAIDAGSKVDVGPAISDAVKSTGKAIGGVKAVAGKVAEGTSKVIDNSEILNKAFAPGSADEIAQRIGQGKTDDIPSVKNVIKNGDIDISKIKSFAGASKEADRNLTELGKQQDTELAKDATPKKLQSLALTQKVGGVTTAHNFVSDAVTQLKNFADKTNDQGLLQKMKNYETKLDPIKGEGLTAKDLNDIAKLHGSKLNAYNANGELASGLTKQAAENTRTGLKTTLRKFLPTGASKALDGRISDLINFKELMNDLAEKANTAGGKVLPKNILQKAGTGLGNLAKATGGIDLAKTAGLITKSPESLDIGDLEARLPRDLSRLKQILSSPKGLPKD